VKILEILVMKIYVPILFCLILLSACGKQNDGQVAKNEERNIATQAKSVVENYIQLIEKYRPKGDEDWMTIVSPDLVLVGTIHGSRMPHPERMYQCSLGTQLIRLSDGKELTYGDVFVSSESEVFKSILKTIPDKEKSALDKEYVIKSLRELNFSKIADQKFNLTADSLTDSCNLTVFDEDISVLSIEQHFTDWMKRQLRL
jgi:hypothetical protein